MATKTLTADRSTILADSNSGLLLGGGQDAHLSVIANPGGYDLRGLIGFSFPAGFFDDMKKVTQVQLRMTGTSSVAHVSKGAAAKALIRRIIASWTANAAGESWTTSPTVYPGPSVTTSGGVTGSLPTGSGQVLVDITTLAMAWAPSSVLGPTGTPGGGAVSYGVALHETGGAADAAEIRSARDGTAGNRPALIWTYDTNARPAAPTLVYPIGPDQAANKFEAHGFDPEGDTIASYDLQVSTDSTFATVTHWTLTNETVGLNGATAVLVRNYGGTPMTVGVRYYWRCRMADAGGDGAWSSTGTFVKAPGISSDDLYDYWMTAILDDMAEGRTVLRVGTLRPRDDEVEALVCAEFGDRFMVEWDETNPPLSEAVYLLGQQVTLDPDGFTVDAVVELVREVGLHNAG